MWIKITKKIKSKYFWFFVFAFLLSFLLNFLLLKYVFISEYKILEKENKLLLLREKNSKLENKVKELKKEEWQKLDDKIIAKSVFIKELSGNEIYSKNSDSLLPIASLTKIMNAIVALNFGDKEVIITKRSLRSEGEYGLLPYENFTLDDAISFMLIESVNDMASAISFGYQDISKHWIKFLDAMNKFVKENGMNKTIFFSENGLDINKHILGSYSTAEDIAKIVEYFYTHYPKNAKETVKDGLKICSNKKCHIAQNTNKLVQKYPEIKFTKTGYTKKAGGSLAVVVEISGKEYIIVILGSTKEGRFSDLELLIEKLKKMNYV